MSKSHDHGHAHTTVVEPGFSLLRISAPARLGLAAFVVALLWLATLAVIL